MSFKTSAPGPDRIRYEDIDRLQEADKQDLCNECNSIHNDSILKKMAVQFNLIPLVKHGKNASFIASRSQIVQAAQHQ
uniref:Uncharacterized protein n=1 Tax=Arion vulgaris TaxID=1028688 RepID=A0A0B7AQ03_9EUPU